MVTLRVGEHASVIPVTHIHFRRRDAAIRSRGVFLGRYGIGLGELQPAMRFDEQTLDGPLEVAVRAFPGAAEADESLSINHEAVGPGGVAMRIPYLELVVHNDWIGETESLDGRLNVRLRIRDVKLGIVHADDFEPVLAVAFVPLLVLGESPDAVDAGVLPA